MQEFSDKEIRLFEISLAALVVDDPNIPNIQKIVLGVDTSTLTRNDMLKKIKAFTDLGARFDFSDESIKDIFDTKIKEDLEFATLMLTYADNYYDIINGHLKNIAIDYTEYNSLDNAIAIAKVLLEKGADANAILQDDKYGLITIIVKAVQNCEVEIVKTLQDGGAVVPSGTLYNFDIYETVCKNCNIYEFAAYYFCPEVIPMLMGSNNNSTI